MFGPQINDATMLIGLHRLMRNVNRKRPAAIAALTQLRERAGESDKMLLVRFRLANAFDKLSPGEQFKALVSDWSIERIQRAIDEMPENWQLEVEKRTKAAAIAWYASHGKQQKAAA